MRTDGQQVEQAPAVAAAGGRAWLRWLAWLVQRGRATLAALGLVLVAGFSLGAAALWFFAELADDVLEDDWQSIDQHVLAALRENASPGLTQAATALSFLGSEGLAVLLLLALGGLVWQRRLGAAVSLLVTVIGAQLLNNLLKLLFVRPRPTEVSTLLPGQSWGFPSGHAMVALAFYGFLAYLGWSLLPWRWRALCLAGLATLVLLIGLSRLYLGVHYFTDVLAGFTAGFVWLDSVILAGHLLARRSALRQSRLPTQPTAPLP